MKESKETRIVQRAVADMERFARRLAPKDNELKYDRKAK